MEDLLMGVNDWRNIQDVVRETFKALHDVVRGQGEKIKSLEQRLAHSASSNDIDQLMVSMSNKVTFGELNKALNSRLEEVNVSSLRGQLAAKADKEDLKQLYGDITTATQRIGEGTSALELLVRQQQSEIEALKREVRKLNTIRVHEEEAHAKFATKQFVEDHIGFETEHRKQSLTNLKKEVLERINEMAKEMERIPSVSTLDQVFAQKVDINTLTKALQDRPTNGQMMKEILAKTADARNAIYEQTNVAIREATEVVLSNARAEIDRVQDSLTDLASRAEVLELVGSKVETDEFENRLSESMDTLASEVKQAVVLIQKDLIQVLNKKAFKSDVENMLQKKANYDDVEHWLASKVDIADVRDILAKKADISMIPPPPPAPQQQEQREDAMEQVLIDRIEELEKEKASIKDVCVLLDQKANIKDVNEALAQLSTTSTKHHGDHERDDFVLSDEVQTLRRELNDIADAMNAELSTGRWIWSSGRALSDRAVPWNIECINTATENFMWKKDSPDITTILPGLYELTVGFFTQNDPQVQILINGEPILYTVVHHHHQSTKNNSNNSHKMKRAKHSAGNITGWTTLDFIALPARARITILYDGDLGAQGFIGLRKL